jgi:hypothetical protein
MNLMKILTVIFAVLVLGAFAPGCVPAPDDALGFPLLFIKIIEL